MKHVKKSEIDGNVYNEIQLILAEKRTAFSSLRTGIAIFALPLSVLSVLVATSRFYDLTKVMGLFLALMVLNLALVTLGVYLIYQSLKRLRHFDSLIRKIKQEHSAIADFL